MSFYYTLGDNVNIDFINHTGFDITINDLNDILLDSKEFILKLLENDTIVKTFFNSKEEKDRILKYIIDEGEIDIASIIINERKPLFSINYNLIKRYRKLYSMLDAKDDINIFIEVSKDNFLSTLEFCKNLNKRIIIKSRDISLVDYYSILRNINNNEYEYLNIEIDYQDLTSPVEIEELFELSEVANDTVNAIINNNLSPLEMLIYAYDIVKKREYKKSEDALSYSRDIHKIIKYNDIVCIGYSNLLSAILSSLHIKNEVLINTEGKHARNIVVLDDDKYDIHIPLFLDATWDSKKKNDENYLNKYNYFAMNLEEASILLHENMHDLLKMDFNKILSAFKIDEEEKEIKRLYKEFNVFNLLNDLFEYLEAGSFDKYIDYTSYGKFEEARKLYNSVKEEYEQKIDPLALAEAIYNVRLVQLDNGIINDFDYNEIKQSVLNRSYNLGLRKIDSMDMDKEEKDDKRIDLFLWLSISLRDKLDKLEDKLEKNSVKRRIRKDNNS